MQGLPVQIMKKKGSVHKDKKHIDTEKVKKLSILQRSSLRTMAGNLGVSKSLIHVWMKEKKLKAHTNAIRPFLTPQNQICQLNWALSQLGCIIESGKIKFKTMYNTIYVDEKWFYLTAMAMYNTRLCRLNWALSLVAAMANHLMFDIYDLDLKAVKSNSQLRALLLSATNRSILVIEDIDCNHISLNRAAAAAADHAHQSTATDDDEKINLSGLLNLIDGLWSCTGEERILVFTTNHRERLDPALLRPGRMDVQLEMSYCKFPAFKMLASNYLSVDDHVLFPEIEELLTKYPTTPAQIARELMKNRDADAALLRLIRLLKDKAG